ncbi:SWEET sugar transporter, partial [Dillenia turbinata]
MSRATLARTIVGIVGNVISFFLFASPAPTFWRILKNKSVEEFKPDPYLATIMNCLFWIFYGMPFVTPDSTLVVTINSIGLAIQLIYTTIFFTYTNKQGRKKVGKFLAAEITLLALVGSIAMLAVHSHKTRSLIVGICTTAFGITMYLSPLTIMFKVIKTKSVEYMPFLLSLANFANGSVWLAYALIKFDPFIALTNGIGAVSGLAQLILYACYYNSTPRGDDAVKRPSEVQLPVSSN